MGQPPFFAGTAQVFQHVAKLGSGLVFDPTHQVLANHAAADWDT